MTTHAQMLVPPPRVLDELGLALRPLLPVANAAAGDAVALAVPFRIVHSINTISLDPLALENHAVRGLIREGAAVEAGGGDKALVRLKTDFPRQFQSRVNGVRRTRLKLIRAQTLPSHSVAKLADVDPHIRHPRAQSETLGVPLGELFSMSASAGSRVPRTKIRSRTEDRGPARAEALPHAGGTGLPKHVQTAEILSRDVDELHPFHGL